MAQNIYDDPEFFDGYAQLPRSVKGLDAAPEWPSVRARLPDIAGIDVVDLGCGYGWFCRWAAEHGAASVLGIDFSEKMLAKAQAETPNGERISYERADLDTASLPAAAFDLAYSSLTLHYIADLDRLLGTVHDALRPGGRFVFSCEHPIRTAPLEPEFITGDDGARRWALDHYLVDGPRRLDWITEGVVKHHRRLSTTISALLTAGFEIAGLEEWCPTAAEIEAHPDWADELHRPSFLIVAADRRER